MGLSVGVMCGLLAPLPQLQAQGSPTDAPRGSARFCIRGRPAPDCKVFLLIEDGYGHAPRNELVDPDYVLWELGAMRNSGRHAFGIGVQWEIGAGDRVAVKPRYSRWLSSSVAVDVAPGIVVWDDRIANTPAGAFSARSPGFTGHVGLNYKDLIAVTGQVEVARFGGHRAQVTPFVGVRLGSYPGIATTLASFVVVGLLAIAVSQSSGL